MIYLLIAILILVAVLHFEVLNREKGKIFYMFLLYIVFVLLYGFRFRIGGDSLSYEESYPFMPTFKDITRYGLYYREYLYAFQPLWLILIAIAKSIGKEFYYFQFLHAIIINGIIMVYLMKYSSKPFSVLFLLYILHYYFYLTIEIEREILAVGVFLFNIKNLVNRKWLPYYLLCFLSFLFHISAIILFLLPLLVIFKISYKNMIIIMIACSPLIFLKEFFLTLIKPLLFMELMEKKVEHYNEIEFSILGILLNYFTRVLCIIPLYYYYYKKENSEDKMWLFNGILIISVLCLGLVGFERFLNYLIIPYVCLFVEFIYSIKFEKNKIFVYSMVGLLSFINIGSNIPVRLLTKNSKGTPYYSLFFPYVTIFEKKIIYDREKYMIENWSE
ncbi:EpsG family protein [Chryseobacterium sp.]|uniref:EpsG family protein n=1 Tax=Chryseobacterium sp. TaxID=1871047 RepID=UPI00388EAA19